MSHRPTTAMLLAAGHGTRMRPLTETTPKPLLPLNGKPLLDHALDRLATAGVTTTIVNAHWQAEQLAAHLNARAQRPPHTILRREPALLETGGGVKAALDLLGLAPFYVVNGDAFWLDGPNPALHRLAAAFNPAEVDAVLLMHRTCQVHGDVGMGDFAIDPWGVPRRRAEREIVPYFYAGLQIVAPALLAGTPDGAFSMNLAWDAAMVTGRLRAVVHDGLWFHLSTPTDLTEAETILRTRLIGAAR